MSLSAQILNPLRKEPITALDALYKLGCFRFAARIQELRMRGHKIHTETTVRNGKRYATYHLLKTRTSTEARETK